LIRNPFVSTTASSIHKDSLVACLPGTLVPTTFPDLNPRCTPLKRTPHSSSDNTPDAAPSMVLALIPLEPPTHPITFASYTCMTRHSVIFQATHLPILSPYAHCLEAELLLGWLVSDSCCYCCGCTAPQHLLRCLECSPGGGCIAGCHQRWRVGSTVQTVVVVNC